MTMDAAVAAVVLGAMPQVGLEVRQVAEPEVEVLPLVVSLMGLEGQGELAASESLAGR